MNTFRTHKSTLLLLALLVPSAPVVRAVTNVPPTCVVLSAVQRPGTTFMDIDYRVDDPDDATVYTTALGFVNGGTSLSDIIKLNTFVEGTAANLGPNTPANTVKHLTWNVAADWNTNFGNVQVEILAKDGRGLLPLHWITLPSNGPNPEIVVNDRPIADQDLLPLWYWLIATADPTVQLINGSVYGVGGVYSALVLATNTMTTFSGRAFLYQLLNVRTLSEMGRAAAGRYGFQSINSFSVEKATVLPSGDRVYAWGNNDYGQLGVTQTLNVSAIAVGDTYTLRVASGFVDAWGNSPTVPAGLQNVTAVASGFSYCVALKSDGTVVVWGQNGNGQQNIPGGQNDLKAIASGGYHILALKSNGTVLAWGYNASGQTNVPAGLNSVVAIAAGKEHSLALKSDGTVVAWGAIGQASVPPGLNSVLAIAAGQDHNLALKSNGTVIAWGSNSKGQSSVPVGLGSVSAIAAGRYYSLALKSDGTVLLWGDNTYGQTNVPVGISSIDRIATGCLSDHVLVLDKLNP